MCRPDTFISLKKDNCQMCRPDTFISLPSTFILPLNPFLKAHYIFLRDFSLCLR